MLNLKTIRHYVLATPLHFMVSTFFNLSQPQGLFQVCTQMLLKNNNEFHTTIESSAQGACHVHNDLTEPAV